MVNAKKTGRKQRHYVASWGETINGLSRRPSDGRWRIIGTQTTYSEPDERRAVERFRRLNAVDGGLEQRQVANRLHNHVGIDWSEVARMIRERPSWVAEQTGIEQIGYLTNLVAPEPSPTFKMLRTLWTEHFTGSSDERQKTAAVLDNFAAATGTSNVGEITPQHLVNFRDKVWKEYSGKTQSHVFNRFRRIMSFAQKRAVAVEQLDKILGMTKILEPNETTVSIDPRPIERAEFHKLLDAAETAADRALLLVMLNAAMYLGEATRLEWGDIRDGKYLVTRRAKTGKVVRVAVLWQETQNALDEIAKNGNGIFISKSGNMLTTAGANKRYKKLQRRAGVDATASQLRDGAYSAAVAANVTTSLCQVLVGHRSGMADHYVLRQPQMVAPACDAIHAAYL